MKASKKLQQQFADFKAEFATLCREFGGTPDKCEPAGPDSAFIIRAPWGNVRASIHTPWGMDMELYAGHRTYSSAGIFLCAADYGDTLPDCWGEWPRPHWKWNIHRSTYAGGMYVECANECLTEFARRLEKITSRKEAATPSVLNPQILEAA